MNKEKIPLSDPKIRDLTVKPRSNQRFVGGRFKVVHFGQRRGKNDNQKNM